jgi:recombinational DNA repair protein (RecF pathway)
MKNQFLQPFCRIELITSKGKSDLYYYKDGSLIENYYAKCTSELAPQFLSGAAALAQTILTSQFLGKPAPKLFQLLDMYLKGMALTIAMHNLISSFQLKLLAHEGLLSSHAQCCSCDSLLSSLWLGSGGEFYCKEHSPAYSIFLKETEAQQMFFLAKSRKLQEIITCPSDLQLSWKIHQFFEQAVQS